jgi:hypothetical protein
VGLIFCPPQAANLSCQPMACPVLAGTMLNNHSADWHSVSGNLKKQVFCDFFNLSFLAMQFGTCIGRKTEFSALPKVFLACVFEI